MALQLSVAVRNAVLDSIETTVSTAPKLQIRTGGAPANCAAADTGSLLAELTLPSNWLADAASGSKDLAGSWTGTASGTGTAAHFRIKDSGGTTTHLQGTVGEGSGDLSLDNTDINSGQTINVTAFTLGAANS